MRKTIFFCGAAVLAIVSPRRIDASYLYNLTTVQSVINLEASGDILGGALTVTEQNSNAVTRYQGAVETNFHAGYGANSRISFPGGGAANAINPTIFGLPYPYSPGIGGGAGSAPANYGITLTAPTDIVLPPIEIPDFGTINLGTITAVNFQLALRETQLSVTSAAQIPIDPVARTFDASLLTINVDQSFADINASVRFKQDNFLDWGAVGLFLAAIQTSLPDLGLTITPSLFGLHYDIGFGTRADLSGASLANAPTVDGIVTYNEVTEASNLTIPINTGLGDIDFGFGNISLTLVGQLRGSATIPNIYHVPEPSSLMLVGIVGLGAATYRRRNLLGK